MSTTLRQPDPSLHISNPIPPAARTPVPPPFPGRNLQRPGRPTTVLRRSLTLSVADGLLAELIGAFSSGAMLTGWALQLGSNPVVLGILGAVPFLLQWVQMPAAWVISIAGRRRVAILAFTLQRLALGCTILLPFINVDAPVKQWLLVAMAGMASLFGMIGGCAWGAWMGDMIPPRIRGRFFGRRTAVCTMLGTLAGLGAGLVLDGAKAEGWAPVALSGLGVVGLLAGCLSLWALMGQHDPAGNDARTTTEWSTALQPFVDPHARRMLTYHASWSAANGLSGAFVTVFLVQQVGIGFAWVALLGSLAAASRMTVSPSWGRVIDRVGAVPVLVVCSFGLSCTPLAYVATDAGTLWPVFVEAIVAGVLGAGHSLASFNLPYEIAPQRARPFYLASFSTVGGIAFGVVSMGAGALVQRTPGEMQWMGMHLVNLQVLFVLTALARLGAAALSLRVARVRGLGEVWPCVRDEVARRWAPAVRVAVWMRHVMTGNRLGL